MDVGLILPSYREGASVEAIDAGAEVAARLGWHSVFTTDHLLVEPSKRSEDYFTIFEALVTVAHVAARQPNLRVGISVVVVPMRNAVQLAKELATLDALSGGRLIAGVGVGWNRKEFGHLGLDDRFGQRGAYLDESIELWRYLWGGGTGPFEGRFHSFEEARFLPLPAAGRASWRSGSAAASRRCSSAPAGSATATTRPRRARRKWPCACRSSAPRRRRPAGPRRPSRLVSGSRSAATTCPSSWSPARPSRWSASCASSSRSASITSRSTSPRRTLQKLVALVERFDNEVLAALR